MSETSYDVPCELWDELSEELALLAPLTELLNDTLNEGRDRKQTLALAHVVEEAAKRTKARLDDERSVVC